MQKRTKRILQFSGMLTLIIGLSSSLTALIHQSGEQSRKQAGAPKAEIVESLKIPLTAVSKALGSQLAEKGITRIKLTVDQKGNRYQLEYWIPEIRSDSVAWVDFYSGQTPFTVDIGASGEVAAVFEEYPTERQLSLIKSDIARHVRHVLTSSRRVISAEASRYRLQLENPS